jgi:putative ABC transport system permease protein
MDAPDPGCGRPPARSLIFRLAAADLAHEWILSSCLVMAVAAVLAPLIILFGIKYGTVEALRDRLLQDPRNREIRPMVSAAFTRPWIEDLARRPDVAFVVPATRQISANVDAAVVQTGTEAPPENTKGKVSLNLIPTLPGDPLILENGATVPTGDACVLSRTAAEALEARVGDTLAAHARRRVGADMETGRVSLRVAGILDARASALKSLFVPLSVVEAVENFKDGLAVPSYGWPGNTPAAYAVYDGLALILPSPLSPVEEFTLFNGNGFTGIERLSPGEPTSACGINTTAQGIFYRLKTGKTPAGEESVACVRSRLRGKSAELIPLVDDIQAVLAGDGRPPVPVTLRSATRPPKGWHGPAVFESPSGAADAGKPPSQAFRKILLPQDLKATLSSAPFSLRLAQDGDPLVFPVEVLPGAAPGPHALIPVRLGALLNLSRSRSVAYDALTDRFVLMRRGYAGFRLYAADLEAVDGLRRHFEAVGIPVHTEAERIHDVQALDRHLTLIFWLIAAVGMAGGAAALSASLYAAIERKQKSLAILRLIGFSGAALFRFPVIQGLCIGLGGAVIAIATFGLFSVLINALFGGHVQAGERLCRLSPVHLSAVLGGAGLLSCLAAGAAAFRATGIEPAEALRDE